jgi:branched-chain amino acid transport system ATP-binding protein
LEADRDAVVDVQGRARMTNALEISDLTLRYGAVQALTNVNLTVGSGELVAVLGANGAGKSSLLNAIAGLIRGSSGSILFEAAPIAGVAAERIARMGVALVPEGRRIFTRLTVKENLLLGGYFLSNDECARHIAELAAIFPILQARLHAYAGHLSGGEQQMLAIARCLMSHPRLLLLDEPSAGLSPIATMGVYESLKQYASKASVSILLVEQNVRCALDFASRGYVLELGSISLTGSAAELAADERVADLYLGTGELD